MSIFSKRLVSIAAGTVLLSLVQAAANAELIDVLTARDPSVVGYVDFASGPIVSTYTFNTSMILNSVGFVTNQLYFEGTPDYTLEYAISSVNNGAFTTVSLTDNNLGPESDYFRWFSLQNAVTLNASDVVTVRTTKTGGAHPFLETTNAQVNLFGAIDSNVNVSVVRNNRGLGANYSNSNLRVSNPGSNVAPEPGSFALALTGGAALLGICVRRRRNAG